MTAKKAPRVATLTLTDGRAGAVGVSIDFGAGGLDSASPAHRKALDYVSKFVAEREAEKKPPRQKRLVP